MQRQLVVNADDFGLSESVNRGILKAHREGIVTSASLMVHWPAARQAAMCAEELDLGLHLDLGEWIFRDGEWILLYERVPSDNAGAIERELDNQLERFRSMTGKDPTHIDSHQHVHLQQPVRSLVKQVADELSVPLRGMTPQIRYCGSFYGQSGKGQPCPEAISLSAMIELLRSLPAGITELGCHPGDSTELTSTYAHERALEVEVLCEPRLKEIIVEEKICLCTFAALSNTEPLPDPAGGVATN